MEGKSKSIDSNRKRYRRILPAKSADSPVGSILPIGPYLRKPKPHTKSACVPCKKRKSKVCKWLLSIYCLLAEPIHSGDRPTCASCTAKGDSCLYETGRSDETRAQAHERKYTELQEINKTHEEIYDFLRYECDADAESMFKRIRRGADAETVSRQIKEGRLLIAAVTMKKESASPPSFQHLLSWKKSCAGLSGNEWPDGYQLTILPLPPRPPDAYKSQLCQDTWTQTGWTKSHVHHLMDALLIWEALSFCFLRHDLFMHSYYSDSARFCSSGLVYAILALASRIVNEDKDELAILPAGWVGSNMFFDKATVEMQKYRQNKASRRPGYRDTVTISFTLRRGNKSSKVCGIILNSSYRSSSR